MTPEVNDIIQGFKAVTQIPVVAGEYKTNLASLLDLGVNNNLAYTYHEGMVIYCIQERRRYEWREVIGSELGEMEDDFVYPDDWFCFGVDYSLRNFNFFLKAETLDVISIGTAEAIDIYEGFNPTIQMHEISKIYSESLDISKSVEGNLIVEKKQDEGTYFEVVEDDEFYITTPKEINIFSWQAEIITRTDGNFYMPDPTLSKFGTIIRIINSTRTDIGKDITLHSFDSGSRMIDRDTGCADYICDTVRWLPMNIF